MVKNIDQCLSTGHEARNETIYHRKNDVISQLEI